MELRLMLVLMFITWMPTAAAREGLDATDSNFRSWGSPSVDRQPEPGDEVVMEAPTYFLAAQVFRDHGLSIRSAPVDAGGLDAIVGGRAHLALQHGDADLERGTKGGHARGTHSRQVVGRGLRGYP